MKPPICAICHDKFFEGGGIIYFKVDADDELFNKRFEQEGFIGHPSNAFWFCEKHFAKAKEVEHLTKKLAMNHLKEHFNSV